MEQILDIEIASTGGSPELQATTIMPPAITASLESVRPEVDLESTLANIDATALGFENPTDLLHEIESAGGGRGRGKGSGMGNLTEGFSKPGGGRVVRKGKFAAWTVPADPKPFQNYLIVIEVEWPRTKDKKLLRARRNDLSGTVVGTDTYYQVIERTGIFIPKSHQMVIPVPGGQQNVRDVIRVKSRMLEESQELTITF